MPEGFHQYHVSWVKLEKKKSILVTRRVKTVTRTTRRPIYENVHAIYQNTVRKKTFPSPLHNTLSNIFKGNLSEKCNTLSSYTIKEFIQKKYYTRFRTRVEFKVPRQALPMICSRATSANCKLQLRDLLVFSFFTNNAFMVRACK